jgi:hypothetical protein
METEIKHKSVEEFSVKTIEFSGLVAALMALRLPFGKEATSLKVYSNGTKIFDGVGSRTVLCIDVKDKTLLSNLVKSGDDHAKVLRGVVVWCEINAPRYFWQEMDRYRIGCECLSSESTMHIQGRGLKEDELVEMKENLVEGTMQKRIWMFSYQTLRRIYFQRRKHRLPQWRKFCEWIEQLPFAKEFITISNG